MKYPPLVELIDQLEYECKLCESMFTNMQPEHRRWGAETFASSQPLGREHTNTVTTMLCLTLGVQLHMFPPILYVLVHVCEPCKPVPFSLNLAKVFGSCLVAFAFGAK